MRVPSHSDAYQALLLQAAADGRGQPLFGESLERARTAPLPFMVGKKFPSVYLEHPLIGDPFMDVTLLYDELEPGTRIASPMAEGLDGLLDWFAGVCDKNLDVCFGSEIDTKDPALPPAAVHFQPRSHADLVEPFCVAAGEPQRAQLYLDFARRMSAIWPLSFFGMFRGRPGAPLRVCGYLHRGETSACTDPRHVARRFDEMGFSSYDERMLQQVAHIAAAAPDLMDFQLDVYPDGSLGNIFALDVQFGIKQPKDVRAEFDDGSGARVMKLLQDWGVADDRWKLAGDLAFARALPVELENGETGKYALTLMPNWLKVRWANGVLQPSKLYLHAHAGLLDT